jgi:hypothetical protein
VNGRINQNEAMSENHKNELSRKATGAIFFQKNIAAAKSANTFTRIIRMRISFLEIK